MSTFSQDSHWKQAAVVLQDPLCVRAGEKVKLTIQLHKSSLSITAVREDDGPVAMDASRPEEVFAMDTAKDLGTAMDAVEGDGSTLTYSPAKGATAATDSGQPQGFLMNSVPPDT